MNISHAETSDRYGYDSLVDIDKGNNQTIDSPDSFLPHSNENCMACDLEQEWWQNCTDISNDLKNSSYEVDMATDDNVLRIPCNRRFCIACNLDEDWQQNATYMHNDGMYDSYMDCMDIDISRTAENCDISIPCNSDNCWACDSEEKSWQNTNDINSDETDAFYDAELENTWHSDDRDFPVPCNRKYCTACNLDEDSQQNAFYMHKDEMHDSYIDYIDFNDPRCTEQRDPCMPCNSEDDSEHSLEERKWQYANIMTSSCIERGGGGYSPYGKKRLTSSLKEYRKKLAFESMLGQPRVGESRQSYKLEDHIRQSLFDNQSATNAGKKSGPTLYERNKNSVKGYRKTPADGREQSRTSDTSGRSLVRKTGDNVIENSNKIHKFERSSKRHHIDPENTGTIDFDMSKYLGKSIEKRASGIDTEKYANKDNHLSVNEFAEISAGGVYEKFKTNSKRHKIDPENTETIDFDMAKYLGKGIEKRASGIDSEHYANIDNHLSANKFAEISAGGVREETEMDFDNREESLQPENDIETIWRLEKKEMKDFRTSLAYESMLAQRRGITRFISRQTRKKDDDILFNKPLYENPYPSNTDIKASIILHKNASESMLFLGTTESELTESNRPWLCGGLPLIAKTKLAQPNWCTSRYAVNRLEVLQQNYRTENAQKFRKFAESFQDKESLRVLGTMIGNRSGPKLNSMLISDGLLPDPDNRKPKVQCTQLREISFGDDFNYNVIWC